MRKFALAAVAALGLAAAAPAVAQAPTVNLSISRVSGGPQGSTTTVQYAELVRISGEIHERPAQPAGRANGHAVIRGEALARRARLLDTPLAAS
jgi:hypothetical protein